MVEHFVWKMQTQLELHLVGELSYFLGFQFKQMKEDIFLSQSKYAKNVVKKFGLENIRHKRTPLAIHIKMTKDDNELMYQSLYISMISSLSYLTTNRPDITFL